MKRHTILFILFASIILIGCKSNSKQHEEYNYRVKVAKVQSAAKNEFTEFSGVVREAKEVNLAFRVAGPIAKMNISNGSYVKKGDLIAEIDSRDYEVQLTATQAEYNKAIDEIKRVKELYNRKSVSEADYQKAIAGEQMITAKLKHANDQLNDTKLYAPFNGYIQNLNYEQGEIVNIGMPVVSLINIDYYNVDIEIPATLFVNRDKFVNVFCQSSLGEKNKIPMQLLNYNVSANSSRLFRMNYRLNPQTDKYIAPGMEVKVIIEYTPTADARIMIPIESIFYIDNTSNVWIFNETDKTISSRKILTDKIIGNGYIIVGKGLTGTETIVTAGVNNLKEGAKVEVIQPKSETNVGGLL